MAQATAELREAGRRATRKVKASAKRGAQTLSDSYDELHAELDDLRTQLGALGTETSDDVRARLTDAIENIAGRVDEFASDAQRFGGRKLEQAEAVIRERPFTSIAVAFGVGVVLAQLMRR